MFATLAPSVNIERKKHWLTTQGDFLHVLEGEFNKDPQKITYVEIIVWMFNTWDGELLPTALKHVHECIY
jgi:hypothetical protein